MKDFRYKVEESGDTVVFSKKCDVTHEDYSVTVGRVAFEVWRRGRLAQIAFPELDADQREFIISGTTPAEWEKLFGSMTDPDTENL